MDYLFLTFVALLGLIALGFLGVFVYRLDRTPEVRGGQRRFNRGLVGLAAAITLVGLLLALLAGSPLADWGLVIGLAALSLTMLTLAAQGFGVGFQQMEEDGVGFLRFFQLGSAIILCLAFVPAFIAFITYASKLK